MNLYAMCGNDGVNKIDSIGLHTALLQPVGDSPTGDNNHFWIGVFFNYVPDDDLLSAVKTIHVDLTDCDTGKPLMNPETKWNKETVVISATANELMHPTIHKGSDDAFTSHPYMVVANLKYPGKETCRKGMMIINSYFYAGDPAPNIPDVHSFSKSIPSLFGYGEGSDLSHKANGSRIINKGLPEKYDKSQAFASLLITLTFRCGKNTPDYDIRAYGSWVIDHSVFRRIGTAIRDKEGVSLNADWHLENDN